MNASVYLAALGLSLSQFIAIGPQNAYVIKQGIGRSYVVFIVVFCIVCDAILISCGVFGASEVVAQVPGLVKAIAWLGACFMFWLGYKSWRAVLASRHKGLEVTHSVERDLKSVLRTLIIVCFFNPYGLLETMVLIGGVSTVYGVAYQSSFLLGCITASALWFVMLGILASQLAPLFKKPISWRILDGGVGCVMFAVGTMLLYNVGFA